MTDIVNDLKVSPDEVELPDKPIRDMQIVKYKMPDKVAPKVVVPIARSDIMYCAVQVLRDGGANNLHFPFWLYCKVRVWRRTW